MIWELEMDYQLEFLHTERKLGIKQFKKEKKMLVDSWQLIQWYIHICVHWYNI